jgi:phage tail sheath gpL-like
MADTSDVENALKALVVAAVYPNGTSQASIVNTTIGVVRGWPTANDLDNELGAGQAIISIFPPPGLERNTTRWPRDEELIAAPVHTLTASVVGNIVTIGGTVAVPQNVIILCGQLAFAYALQSNDTLATVATNLAALIAAQFPGTNASGPTITIAGKPGIVQARIASTAQFGIEQSRQEKTYWITCWCPTPAMRDILAPAIDVALKQLDFITVGVEQSEARLRYARSNTSDEGQKVQIYRRDLVYTAEFGTFTIATATETGAVGLAAQVGAGPAQPTIFT